MKTILIANRGEIACRIIKTARKLGYGTVAVFSEPDRNALHVKLADKAVSIGGRTPGESYLSIEKILDACATSGTDAVHPGYGFLSENADFAQACAERGLTFIGPTAEAIRAMGNKSQAKALMIEAGVPCIPGYQGADQDTQSLIAKGREIGFPLMIKAAAGGGGRGLRLAKNPDELKVLIQAARSEAEKSFGSGELLLERALTEARHVEVQVFGDKQGNVIHLGERDCSIQRRHQKVFEESPSPAVSARLREDMGAAAVKAAKAINYVGAGTVEFLLDRDGQYYFLEMNTRLQVEHPVTELVTGQDLVEWQLNVAAGKPLPLKQEDVRIEGHAIEARLYAEDPDNDFRPQVGEIVKWRPPSEEFARTDHGLNETDEVSPYYDSMLAKVIASGPDRETATRLLERALADTVILGIKTNREFLLHCLDNEQFKEGRTDTGFIGRVWKPAKELHIDLNIIAMAVAAMIREAVQGNSELTGWSSSGQMQSMFKLSVNDLEPVEVRVEFQRDGSYLMCLNGEEKLVTLPAFPGEFLIDGIVHKAEFICSGDTVHISSGKVSCAVSDVLYRPKKTRAAESDGDVLSPSNGLLSAVDVQIGQFVQKDDPVCTVEAMKLMQTLSAPISGCVTEILSTAGQQVKAKQLLLRIEPEQNTPSDEPASKSEKNALVEV